jgi:hypothetical protein
MEASEMRFLWILPAAMSAILCAVVLLAGEGDEEGEFYGGKWPADIPKTTPVKFYLPFPAGKSFGQLPGAASHTALQNKHAIDFSMRIGSPVCASADGIVIKIIESGPDRGGKQNSLIIQHADGMCTCYLHLKNKGVIPKLGDFVFQGDVVAYSGASGTGTPHLHFSVNKFEMLESVPIEFVEAKNKKQWVSQNYSFEQKYAKKLKSFRDTELALLWGPKFNLWEQLLEARKNADKLKPEKKDDVRLHRKYKKIEEAAKSFDEALKAYLTTAKEVLKKDDAESLVCASFGAEDFKDTEHEKMFADKLAQLKELKNYKELEKKLRKAKQCRKKIEKAFETDLKGSSAKKTIKEYATFAKKYKDVAEAIAAQERAKELNASEKEGK